MLSSASWAAPPLHQSGVDFATWLAEFESSLKSWFFFFFPNSVFDL